MISIIVISNQCFRKNMTQRIPLGNPDFNYLLSLDFPGIVFTQPKAKYLAHSTFNAS